MRRIYCIILISVLLSCLCGCTHRPQVTADRSTSDSSTLHMVHFLEPDGKESYDLQLHALLQLYTEQTGVQIHIKTLPWDQLDETLLISSQSGEPLGDLFILSSQKLEYLVNSKALMPLDDYFNASFKREEFLPYALEAGTSSFDNQLYLLPQALHTRGLWYNKNYVSDPPETLDELLTVSQQVMAENEDVYGLGFWGGSHYGAVEGTLNMLTWAFGGKLSATDGRAAWNNDAVARSIRLLHDWVYRYGISPEICLTTADCSDVQSLFLNGGLAMLFDGCFAVTRDEFRIDPSVYGFAPMPGVDGPGSNFSNGWSWGIPVNAAQPDLAWQFIEWFLSTEIQVLHAIAEGSIPVRIDALSDSRLTEAYPYMNDFIDNQRMYGRPMDTFIYYNEAMESLTSLSSEYALDPSIDLETALAESEVLFNKKFYP